MRTTHKDRVAFIDHLEKKYSQKIQHYKLGKQERSVRQQLRTIRGTHMNGDLDYEATDFTLLNGRRLAY